MVTKTSMGNILRGALAVGLSLTLYGCGAGSTTQGTTVIPGEPLAQQSDISIAGSRPGVTPFISSVQLAGQSVSQVTSVTFNISPMRIGAQLVNVTWSRATLFVRGYLQADLINLPVFGLYAGYQNQVSFELGFDDTVPQQQLQMKIHQPIQIQRGLPESDDYQSQSAGEYLGIQFFHIEIITWFTLKLSILTGKY